MRELQLNFVKEIMERTRLRASPLAQAAGLDPSSLSRFFTKDGKLLRQTTLAKLAAVAGIEVPEELRPHVHPSAMTQRHTAALEDGKVGLTMVDNTMIHCGIKAGDELVFDPHIEPQHGHVVAVDIAPPIEGQAAQQVRLLIPPQLIASGEPTMAPLYADGQRVVIIGVLVMQKRDWRNQTA